MEWKERRIGRFLECLEIFVVWLWSGQLYFGYSHGILVPDLLGLEEAAIRLN